MGLYLMWGIIALALLLVFAVVPGLGLVVALGALVILAVAAAATAGTWNAETRRERHERFGLRRTRRPRDFS